MSASRLFRLVRIVLRLARRLARGFDATAVRSVALPPPAARPHAGARRRGFAERHRWMHAAWRLYRARSGTGKASW